MSKPPERLHRPGAGLDVPADELAQFDDEAPGDRRARSPPERISTVIWTIGYRPGFG